MKNLVKSRSPRMYPMEYRWISAEMKVTNSTIVTDSGSRRNETLTWSDPTGIQVNRL